MNLDVTGTLRIEKKFKLFACDLPLFLSWLQLKTDFRTSFDDRSVNSLYFDDIDYSSASSNMSGESKRVKVRLRSYSDDHHINQFFVPSTVECKRKFNGVSDKISFPLDSFSSSIYSLENHLNNKLFEKYSVKFGRLSAKVLVSYTRSYFESRSNSNLRLTLDRNIFYSFPLSISKSLLSKDYCIVEIKFPPSYFSEVNDLLVDFPLRSVRFSKYLSCISRLKNVSY